MKKEPVTLKKRIVVALISLISTGVLVAIFVSLYANSTTVSKGKITNTQVTNIDTQDDQKDPIKITEMMPITLFVQNKEAAATADCGITEKVTRQVPKTSAIADASLKYLFSNELKQYGTYDSVTIANGIATVNLKSDSTPSGTKISSLSSCEVRHLQAVVTDTLTQYKTVQSVVFMSPQGKIQF